MHYNVKEITIVSVRKDLRMVDSSEMEVIVFKKNTVLSVDVRKVSVIRAWDIDWKCLKLFTIKQLQTHFVLIIVKKHIPIENGRLKILRC